ncbi:MAG: LacI family DNA-binding transcriptional regulator, partial [Cellulosimicrobium funkei]
LGGFAAGPGAPWPPPPPPRGRPPLVVWGAGAGAVGPRARSASGRTLRTELATSLVVRASTAAPRA